MDHWLEPVFRDGDQGALKVKEGAGSSSGRSPARERRRVPRRRRPRHNWYVLKNGAPAKALAESQPRSTASCSTSGASRRALRKTVLAAVDALGDTAASFDMAFVDAIIAAPLGIVVAALGRSSGRFRTASCTLRGAVMVIGLAAFGWFFRRPHADASITERTATTPSRPAPAWLRFRWDATTTASPTPSLHRERFAEGLDAVRRVEDVRLEVVNAFGLVGKKTITVSRPAAPQKTRAWTKLT